jgi:hypothetical protein
LEIRDGYIPSAKARGHVFCSVQSFEACGIDGRFSAFSAYEIISMLTGGIQAPMSHSLRDMMDK